ncbi:MAG TPA: glucosaminidase domain-containing protein [Bacteroidaceae bacterium]|nr:glucosaminidase domain-containing protein [Bacteroidaceae bacterium]
MNYRLLRNIFTSFVFFLLITPNISAQENAFRFYIEKYKKAAIDQMRRYGIPASITLAQGLLESDAGRSTLALEANNHFGIKCHNGWRGKTIYHDDDRKDDCFRKYNSVKESFEDHSIFLSTHQRYAFLFELKTTDYKGWARGLKQAGYATSATYSEKLISIIERYSLYQYDRKAIGSSGIKYFTHQPMISNGLLYIRLGVGETLKDIAKEFDISRAALRRYNEIDKRYVPESGSVIYLEKKKRKASKDYSLHVVRTGESLWSISQLYGVRMKVLIARNNLGKDNPLMEGAILKVR